MNCRSLIALLGATAAWPVAARAQQAALPIIGYLSRMADTDANRLRPFREGLGEEGFVEGRNVRIEYRATTPGVRVAELAADLIRRPVRVIVGAAPFALAAKAVTGTVPILFWAVVDPVQIGLVASLNRPGGDVTGVITGDQIKRQAFRFFGIVNDPAEQVDLGAFAQLLGLDSD